MSEPRARSLRVTEPRWVFPSERTELAQIDLDEAARVVGAELKLPSIVAKVLVARGYRTPADAKKFLSDALTELPDPFTMKGLPQAVDRIVQAILTKEAVTLYGDYDVDGVSSTALLTTFLRQVGLEVRTYIPHRLEEGYGLNRAAIERLAAEGTRLLITLDCGITSHAEIERANSLGVNVIVVDHHAVPEVMPNAVAVLNPLQPGCGYPTKCAVVDDDHVHAQSSRRCGMYVRTSRPTWRRKVVSSAVEDTPSTS